MPPPMVNYVTYYPAVVFKQVYIGVVPFPITVGAICTVHRDVVRVEYLYDVRWSGMICKPVNLANHDVMKVRRGTHAAVG